MRIPLKSLLAVSALALLNLPSAHAADFPKACGTDATQFKVKADEVHTLSPPSADKAQIVFIERLANNPAPATVRFALDGAWMGATKGNSYFVVNVDPGVHHLCAVRQSNIHLDKDFAPAHAVRLQAGMTYFYEFTVTHNVIGWARRADGGAGGAGMQSTPDMTLRDGDAMDVSSFGQLNQQLGQERISRFRMSAFSQK